MEVSPRDGLQNEDALVSTEDKLKLIDRALVAGCKRIEVTSFVNPKVVPQMADAEAVCAGLPQRGDVRYTGLVLNQRGYDRLRATERLNEAGLVIAASDTFGERNQGMDIDAGLAMAKDILRQGRDSAFPVQVTIAVAFGCPFEGDVPLERLVHMVTELVVEEPVEIALADTIGVGVPQQVEETFTALKDIVGDIPLRAHFHDTRNTGIGNAYAAVKAGVQTLDASIGGIGGCPFAPNATGNIATEDLVYMLNRSGIEHGVGLENLIDSAQWLEGVLDKSIPSSLLRAGDFLPKP
ncbi:MAG: hydroxymethylglutaryl-CoA lyase [Pseudomonadales bacterium]|nr:hydroxymethylglutaryl-CoA lyase [Pseudomonadales bacterium]